MSSSFRCMGWIGLMVFCVACSDGGGGEGSGSSSGGNGNDSGTGGSGTGGVAAGSGTGASAGSGAGSATGGAGGVAAGGGSGGGGAVGSTCTDGLDNDGDGSSDDSDDDCNLVNQFEAPSNEIVNGKYQGWTHYAPSADSKIIYVSESGNDSNDGLSEQTPKKTMGSALPLLRDGYPDWLLLHRGETFDGGVKWPEKNGRSETERIVIGSYGAGSSARPHIRTGTGEGFQSIKGASHIALVGLHFHADERDPASPTYDPNHASNPTGITWQAPLASPAVRSNFRVEDCVLQAFHTGLVIQDRRSDSLIGPSGFDAPDTSVNFEMIRTLVLDSHSVDNAHSQGIYVHGISGITFIENVFDRNGWLGSRDTGPGIATIFNHNLYVDTEHNRDLVVLGNIIMRASSHGLQARPGGIIEDNLFVENPLHLLVGGGEGTSMPDDQPFGVNASVRRNVILGTADITGTIPRGFGIETLNINQATLEQNVLAHGGFGTNHRGVRTDGPTEATAPSQQVVGNVVFDWERGFESTGAKNLVRDKNVFSDTNVSGTTDQASESYAFPDSTRSIDTYQASLGQPAGTDAFANEVRKQAKGNYRAEYTAAVINAWVRQGFGIP